MEQLKEHLRERGDTKFYQIAVQLGYTGEAGDEVWMYAGGHMDKKPLTIVGDCGLTLDGPQKVRHRYRY